ncbi:hypothetical protein RJ639_043797 [Escallonia herrerae]|uniref:Reticulon-like protein n=1 Tax=Escallonia herrerae TaxID=1293975 RepID=A0AA89B1W7_9ASTE|nr:hypothetical protein RJ639_043797 [Escallonia herrerae]
MAEHDEVPEHKEESLMEKIAEKFHGDDSTSSSSLSDSDAEKEEKNKPAAAPDSSVKAKIFRLFGREEPVHKVFGGGKLLFLWSNASTFINKSPPRIPEVRLPEDPFIQVAAALRIKINRAIAVLRDIASGRDLKKFVAVITGLWVLSVVGSWCNFLTLFYITFVLLHTLPVLYEKYEHKIDPLAEKAVIEIKKQYAVFDAKVLSKIPRGPLKDKKRA